MPSRTGVAFFFVFSGIYSSFLFGGPPIAIYLGCSTGAFSQGAWVRLSALVLGMLRASASLWARLPLSLPENSAQTMYWNLNFATPHSNCRCFFHSTRWVGTALRVRDRSGKPGGRAQCNGDLPRICSV